MKHTAMKLRKLGNAPFEVSPLCLGTNVFGWTIDEATSHALLDAWVDAGMNFIDTADMYSRWVPGHTGGESETVIGNWLKKSGKRDRIVLATKVGKDMGDGKVGLKPAYIRRAVEDSLRRLRTDVIDLYQSHDDDSNTPMEETLAAYGNLIDAGKVRAIGASNFSATRLRQALDIAERNGLPRYESLQPLFNLYDRAPFEDELEDLCVQRDVGVLNFYGLAAGFLTGKYRSEADADKSARGSGAITKYLNARGLKILAALDEVAAECHATPGQVALAWQIARPSITAPIASATSRRQLDELIGAAALRLDDAAIERLNQASA